MNETCSIIVGDRVLDFKSKKKVGTIKLLNLGLGLLSRPQSKANTSIALSPSESTGLSTCFGITLRVNVCYQGHLHIMEVRSGA